MMLVVTRPTVISIYSGAGGMDLGFIDAGFDVIWANDADPHAVRTYNANIGEHAVCGDVLRVLMPDVSPDVLIGGPPCQVPSPPCASRRACPAPTRASRSPRR